MIRIHKEKKSFSARILYQKSKQGVKPRVGRTASVVFDPELHIKFPLKLLKYHLMVRFSFPLGFLIQPLHRDRRLPPFVKTKGGR